MRVIHVHCSALTVLVLLLGGVLPGSAGAENPEPFPASWFWGEDEQKETHTAMVGAAPPALTVTHWHGDELSIAELKGKVVLIDFWATWCGPCISAIPKTNALLEEYEEKGLVVIGVCGTNGSETMVETAEQHDMKFPTAKDVEKQTQKAWNVMWWPTYALVDHTGKVRAVGLQTSRVEDAVKILIEEKLADEARAGSIEKETVDTGG